MNTRKTPDCRKQQATCFDYLTRKNEKHINCDRTSPGGLTLMAKKKNTTEQDDEGGKKSEKMGEKRKTKEISHKWPHIFKRGLNIL